VEERVAEARTAGAGIRGPCRNAMLSSDGDCDAPALFGPQHGASATNLDERSGLESKAEAGAMLSSQLEQVHCHAEAAHPLAGTLESLQRERERERESRGERNTKQPARAGPRRGNAPARRDARRGAARRGSPGSGEGAGGLGGGASGPACGADSPGRGAGRGWREWRSRRAAVMTPCAYLAIHISSGSSVSVSAVCSCLVSPGRSRWAAVSTRI
jgi:hypothetical protein